MKSWKQDSVCIVLLKKNIEWKNVKLQHVDPTYPFFILVKGFFAKN